MNVLTKAQGSQDQASTKPVRTVWLALARGGWVAIAGGCVLLLLVALPVRFTLLAHPPAQVQAGLHALGVPLAVYAFYNLVLDCLVVLGFFVAAGLLFWRKSGEWFPLFVALLLVTFGVDGPILVTLGETQPAWSPLTGLMDTLGWGLLGFFFSLFPDGRFVPGWTRWYSGLFFLLGLLWDLPLPAAFHPYNWPPVLFLLFQLGPMVVFLGVQVYRYGWISGQVQRQQTKWLLSGLAVALCTLPFLTISITPDRTPANFFGLFVIPALRLLWLFLPFSLCMAILRYRLWDIDQLINRTLIYAGLSASSLGIYLLVVFTLGTFFQAQDNIVISLLATGIIAVLFQPLRTWLQGAINRLMFGERDNPYAVLSRLGRRLEATFAPDEILPAIVETVAHSLKLPYVALNLMQESVLAPVASYGTAAGTLVHLPLCYQSETIGELLLAPRAADEAFTANEQLLLKELARQAGIAVHGVLLAADLERSRQRIVTTREQARRQLGSDLHDGLGHQLAGLLRKIEFASNLLERDPAAVGGVLDELKQHTRTAINETRRLAHELHPPELELLGLTAALREQIQQYHQPQDKGLQVTIQTPSPLPQLPIAVESAAYYIALEALNNVARHARAQHCTLRLNSLQASTSSAVGVVKTAVLELEIADDGCGLAGDETKKAGGLGLTSMRERATELGGTCLVESSPTGGTRIYARLPCR
jgi:signal transduction histidine kinase